MSRSSSLRGSSHLRLIKSDAPEAGETALPQIEAPDSAPWGAAVLGMLIVASWALIAFAVVTFT
jgi:hypothetical protein